MLAAAAVVIIHLPGHVARQKEHDGGRMLIVCPQCGFSRNVSKERLKGHFVTVTCPKCDCRFRLYANGVMDVLRDRHNEGASEEDRRIVASRAYEAEKRRWESEENGNTRSGDLPWDKAPAGDSWPGAFLKTVIGVMFTAPVFFSRIRNSRSLMRPLLFYLIICVFQICVERLWMDSFISFFNSAPVEDEQLRSLVERLTPQTGFALSLILRSGVYVLQLYLTCFLMDMAFRLAAPDKSSFNIVFQILSYSASPWLLCVIPGLGSFAGFFWGIGCVAIGCRVALKLDWVQVFVGFLPPLILLLPVLYVMIGALQG